MSISHAKRAKKPLGAALSVALLMGMAALGGAEEQHADGLGDDLVYPGNPKAVSMPSPEAPPPSSPAVVVEPAAPVKAAGETEFERMLNQLSAEEQGLQTELDGIGPALLVVNQRKLARARAHVRHLRAGVLPAGGGFDALVDHAATVERTRLALERDVAKEAELTKRRGELLGRLQKIRALKAPLLVQKEAMTRASLALKQADERQAAFARAFESSSKPPDYMAIYGADLRGSDGGGTEGFRTLRGRLPMPVAGRAEARRVVKAGASGPGLELLGMEQAAVRSVALGRVVFAERYEPYGLTAIVDHGDGYATVYGNLGALDVKIGDVVRPNMRLGVAADAGGGRGRLYFEIRRRAEMLDPGLWLGI